MPSIHILSRINKGTAAVGADATTAAAAPATGLIFGQSPWLVGGIAVAAAGVGGYFLLKDKSSLGPKDKSLGPKDKSSLDPRDVEDFYSADPSDKDSYAYIQRNAADRSF